MNKNAIVLTDGQATPVAHTFSPLQSLADFDSWADRSGGISIGQPVLTLSIRRPQKNAPSNRVRLSVSVPTLEVSSPSTGTGYQPAPKVAYTHLANVDFVCPDRGALSDRKNLVAYLASALWSDALLQAVYNAEMPY